MKAKALGIIKIRWNGVEYPCEGSSTYRPYGMNRTSIPHTMGAGYRETPSMGRTTVSIPPKEGLPRMPTGEGELQVLCDTGQAYSHPVAWTVGDEPELSTSQSTAREFEHGPGEEIRWR